MSGDSQEYYEQEGVAMTCRSYEEYVRMFACDFLQEKATAVLDAAAGASSFAAEARRQGIRAVSADPLYRLAAEDMEAHGLKEIEEVSRKLGMVGHRFDWTYYGSPEAHERRRRESFALFMEDYRSLRGTDAYVLASLPELPFPDNSFSHVLCSHFLFLYGEQFSYEFHRNALAELARVCKPGGAVRVYPLLDLKWNTFPGFGLLLEELRSLKLEPELLSSRLPFMPASNQLLLLRKSQDLP
jgi:SAM-dependent methyltransferase